MIPSSAVTTYPRGTPVPTPSIKVQVIEERVDLSNNLTWRQMIGVGVRRVVLARGELDKLEGPQYAARRAELRREAGEAARARDRQAAVALQNEAEESGATEEEATGRRENDESRKTAGWRAGCSENRRQAAKRDRKRQTPKGGRRLAPHSPLLKNPYVVAVYGPPIPPFVWWRCTVLPSLPWVVCFLSFFFGAGRVRPRHGSLVARPPARHARAAEVELPLDAARAGL